MIQKHHKEFIRYLLVGGTSTVVDWSCFYASHTLAKTPHTPALIFALSTGTLTHYILNQVFTFKVSISQKKKQLVIYTLIVGFSFVCNIAIMNALISGLTLPAFPSRVITTGLMVVVNYLMHKFTTFNPNLYDPLPPV